MVEVSRYTPAQATEWNEFVARSKNGTFLFDRGYMDYHVGRFADHSLMVRREGRLVAVLPANVVHGQTLFSHQGLTYGGLVMSPQLSTTEVCDIFLSVNEYLKTADIHKVIYKPVPWIYASLPSEEDLYALVNVCGARLLSRQVSSVLTSRRLKFAESRRSGIRKAVRAGLTVRRSTDVEAFWRVLSDGLRRKYDAAPVHSAEEMRLLMSRFPEHIKLFVVERNGGLMGGTVVYETPCVAHTQYISATEEGRAAGALDMLFDELLHRVYADIPYFDFGTSLTSDRQLNNRLIFQKEGFGGRAVCYDCYEWNVLIDNQQYSRLEGLVV